MIRVHQSQSELAHDEATRLGWVDKPGQPGPVDWMVGEIERLRAASEGNVACPVDKRTDFEKDMM